MFSQGSKVIVIDAKVPRVVFHRCLLSKHRTEGEQTLSSSNIEPPNLVITSETQGKLRWERVSMAVLAKQQENGLLTATETSIGNLLVELFYIN